MENPGGVEWLVIMDGVVVMGMGGSYRILGPDHPEAQKLAESYVEKMARCLDARRMLRAIGITLDGDDLEGELA